MTRLDFVPGTLCDERMWSRLTPLLGDGFEFNHVPLHKARTRPQMQELISAHSAPSAHLVAFSLGAYLATEYALAHPERVKSLTIIGSSARGLSEKERALRLRIIPMLDKATYIGMSQTRLRELLAPAHLHDAGIVDTIQQMALDLGKDVLLAQFTASMDRPDLMERLAEISCPVLLVGAAGDQLVNSAYLQEMLSRLPDARLSMHEGSGHMIPLEVPQALAADILAFHGAA